jgi:hypothetical protein
MATTIWRFPVTGELEITGDLDEADAREDAEEVLRRAENVSSSVLLTLTLERGIEYEVVDDDHPAKET